GAVAGSPVEEVGLGVVVARHPGGAATGSPGIIVGPALAPGLPRGGDDVRAPDFLPRLGVERGDEAADAALSSRDTHHHLTVRHERCDGEIEAVGELL